MRPTPPGACDAALDLPPTPTIKVDAPDAEALAALEPDQIKGKVVLAAVPSPDKVGSLADPGGRTGPGSPSCNGWRN